MTELLYELHAMTQLVWELSKNPEITSIAEQQKELLERLIGTISTAFDSG